VLDLDFGAEELAEKAHAALVEQLGREASRRGTTVEVPLDEGPQGVVDALRVLESVGLTPAGLTVREPSLDDVFLALTGHVAEDASQ
jgi:ABC-2 type transport system ATP-binding protein